MLFRFNGEYKLHLRTCAADKVTGVLYPTKEGMTLSAQQFIDLIYYIPDIRAALDTEDADTSKRHIGKNTYVEVYPSRTGLEVRDYYFLKTKELHPTRRAISLTTDEFTVLENSVKDIVAKWPRIDTNLVPCFEKHDTVESFYDCRHCNPPYGFRDPAQP